MAKPLRMPGAVLVFPITMPARLTSLRELPAVVGLDHVDLCIGDLDFHFMIEIIGGDV